MKRKIMALICSLCVISLVGCSEKTTILNWDYGVLTNNGAVIDVDIYDGFSANKVTDELSINYYSCVGPRDCGHKVQEVDSTLMTKFNDTRYFTAFFDTVMEMYYERGENNWNEGTCTTMVGSEVGVMANAMNETLKALILDGTVEIIRINNCVDFKASSNTYEVRKDCVIVPGYIKIGTNDGSVAVDNTKTFGELTVGFKSSPKYDYYLYNDVLIQIVPGIDITQYVDFHEVK